MGRGGGWVVGLDSGGSEKARSILLRHRPVQPVEPLAQRAWAARGIIHAAASSLGVGLVPKYTVLTELAHGTLVDLFPDLALLEDVFRIYQKRSLADGEANRQVTSI